MTIRDDIVRRLSGDPTGAVPWIVNERGCWIWQRGFSGKDAHRGRGYGCFKDGGRSVLAHRFTYELVHGPIVAGMQLLHQCDDTRCVNPYHTRQGTNTQNQKEAAERGLKPSRLAIEQVRDIKRRCAAGEFQRVLAAGYDLHQADVSNIVNGKYWRHA